MEYPQQSGVQLSERLASLGIMREQLKDPLKLIKHREQYDTEMFVEKSVKIIR